MMTETAALFPLSLQQREIASRWRDAATEEIPRVLCVIALEGEGRIEALKSALDWLVRRHEILRTTFLEETPGGNLIQRVEDRELPSLGIEHDPPGEASKDLDTVVTELLGHSFDWSRGPLFDFRLWRRSSGRSWLSLQAPVLCADGSTLELLAGEWAAAYEAKVEGRSPNAEEPLQYADYAQWLDETLSDEEAAVARDFWGGQRVPPEGSPLPFERPRTGESKSIRLLGVVPVPLRTLEPLSRPDGQAFLLTCWLTLLGRLAGGGAQTSWVFLPGRRYDELKDVLGPCDRRVPVSLTDLGTASFRVAQRRLAAVLEEGASWLEYFRPQDIPGLEVAKIRTSLAWQSPLWGAPGPLRWREIHRQTDPPPGSLELVARMEGSTATLEIHHDRGRFQRADMEALAERLVCLAEAAAQDPQTPLATLPLLTPAERQTLLVEVNKAAEDDSAAPFFETLFDQMVSEAPDAPAILASDLVWSYRDLDRRVTALARRLAAEGVGPGSLVALFLERSPEMMVAVIAVLKAGAAYLPLEVDYPAARIQGILAEAQPALVLTAGTAPPLPGSEDELHRYLVVEDWVDEPEGAPPLLRADGYHPAYVLYTSGSTGRPKGVVVPRRALANYLLWGRRRYRAGSSGHGVSLVHSPLGFDLSVTSLLLPLTRGAAVQLLPMGEEIEGMLEILGRPGEVGLIKVTPAHLTVFGAGLPDGKPKARIGTLVVGGDALFHEGLTPWIEASEQVINEYGPTETTVGCTTYEASRQESITASGPMPIGLPVSNTRVFVLDPRGEPVPPGAVGELFIGGRGVAEGYLGQPGITAERFLPDPFATEPGARYYRSGDLVRQAVDGGLTYLGRSDQQVKVHGYRIELGEIEALLLEHPALREAVVMLRRDASGHPRLVVYAVSIPGQRVGIESLRRYLGERLPEPMIPASFVFLGAFPLTANGKVDRTALPEPEAARPDLEQAFVAPRNELESQLAEVWCQVLGLDEVGVQDDFIALGGDSILGMQVIGRVRQRGWVLDPRDPFRNPTIEELARAAQPVTDEAIDETWEISLTPSQQAYLLQRRLEGVEDVFPLSPLQEGLLFLSLEAPDAAVHQPQLSGALRGNLEPANFAAACRFLIERHGALRTAFAWEAVDPPVQEVFRKVPTPLTVLDWRRLDPEEQERELTAFLERDRLTGFDLQRPPLMRIALIQMAQGHHHFVWSHHHLVIDGWSVELLIEELFACLGALQRGETPDLPAPRPYRDYIAWLHQQDHGAAETYWRRRLEGFHQPLEITADTGMTVAPGEEAYRSLGHHLPPHLDAEVRRWARRRQVTLATLIQGLWALLLSRYTGCRDVVFGAITGGRPPQVPGVENMVGMFVNTLPVRVEVDPSERPGPWLQRLQEAQSQARNYEHSPLAEVQRWSDLSPGTPLFETLVLFENHPVSETASLGGGEGVSIAEVDLAQRVNYPLSLFAAPQPEISLVALFDVRHFDPGQARLLLGHLNQLLEGLIAKPAGGVVPTLGSLSLLTPAERQQLLLEWNETARTLPKSPEEATLPAVLARRAAEHPEAPAWICGEDRLSYGALEGRTTALAHSLQQRGLGPGSRVGVFLDRSTEMMVAFLGVLKAGAAYVPIDPNYPLERIAWVLEDSDFAALLSRRSLLERLPAATVEDRSVILVEEESLELSALVDLPTLEPEAIAYVIYTSGSTGRPKGVQISHRSLLNFLHSMAREPGLSADDVLLSVTTLSFDILGLELYLPLLVGGTVALATEAARQDASSLVSEIERVGATVMQGTPSLWRLLLDGGWEGDPRLRAFCGGEALPPGLATALSPRVAELWNLYGPTETTIWSTVQKIEAGEAVTIGRPIDNTVVRVLNRSLELVPVGQVGELYLGGEGLAHGYLKRPALTAERFLPDPYSRDGGARLYRTGDLVRQGEDGVLDCLGRLDHQVKIRGHRIELGEIEATLSRHPSVRQAVVSAAAPISDSPASNLQLVAFVVPEGAAVEAPELREFLHRHLPEIMVPYVFHTLEQVPLTPNGKVDRQRLPDLRTRGDVESSGRAPRTATEEITAGVWREVFGTKVGIHDHFLALGGHSLIATRIVSRLRRLLEVELPLRVIFEQPTIAGLARQVEALRGARVNWTQGFEESALEPVPAGEELSLSFAQQRLWFLEQLYPGSSAFNLPGALQVQGDLVLHALAATLEEIARRHAVLRSRFPTVEGEPKVVVAPPAPLPLPVVDLRGLGADAEVEARRLTLREGSRPFDIATGPIWRVALLRIAVDEHVVLFTQHHIVSDAWSTGILMREISTFYDAFAADRPSRQPEPTLQYHDFARWQREWLQHGVLEEQLAYWRRQLAGELPLLELPADRPRPEVQTFRGKTRGVGLSATVGQGIRRLAHQEGATVFMVMLAAFKILLRHLCHEDDIIIGTDVANRNRVETEGLIGFFVNQLVLRTDLSGEPTFREVIARVRRVVLDASAHQDVPFEKLLSALDLERSVSRSALFQIKFFFENVPEGDLDPGGLTVRPLEVNSGGVNLEFTLSLGQEADGALGGRVSYNTDLFEDRTIDRLLQMLERICARVVEHPEVRTAELTELLATVGREQRKAEREERRRIRRSRFQNLELQTLPVTGETTKRELSED